MHLKGLRNLPVSVRIRENGREAASDAHAPGRSRFSRGTMDGMITTWKGVPGAVE